MADPEQDPPRHPPLDELLEDLGASARKTEELVSEVRDALRRDADVANLAATNDPPPDKPRRRRKPDRRKPQDR